MFNLFSALILLILASAFFSSSETAIFSLSRLDILRLKGRKSTAAKNLFKLVKKPRDVLTTILFGNELSNVGISIVGSAIVGRIFHLSEKTETFIAIAVATPIVLIFGEIIPKTIALNYSWNLAILYTFPLSFLNKLTTPFRNAISFLLEGAIRIVGRGNKQSSLMIMEEEYKTLIERGARDGILEQEEYNLIHNVFAFGDKEVSSVMTAREMIFAVPADMPYHELVLELGSTKFSRVPIYKGDLDNVIGVLHKKDLFIYDRQLRRGIKHELEHIIRQPLFISPRETLEKLLHIFQSEHMHMAIVKDRSKTIGLVTLDDILKELVGKTGAQR